MAAAAASDLLSLLATVPDPRAKRGVRHRLACLRGIAVVTVLGGATNFREIGDQAADPPQVVLAAFDARYDPWTCLYVAPSPPMLRRTIHAITSLTAKRGTPERIATAARRHWTVEAVHYVRDVTWHEDGQHAYTGNGPRVMAARRNLALSALRIHGT